VPPGCQLKCCRSQSALSKCQPKCSSALQVPGDFGAVLFRCQAILEIFRISQERSAPERSPSPKTLTLPPRSRCRDSGAHLNPSRDRSCGVGRPVSIAEHQPPASRQAEIRMLIAESDLRLSDHPGCRWREAPGRKEDLDLPGSELGGRLSEGRDEVFVSLEKIPADFTACRMEEGRR